MPCNFTVSFNDATLFPSSKVKILGIIVDQHLTWEGHVSLVVRRCYATLRGMSKLARRLSNDVKKFLIEALVLPHIMYCITVWGGCGAVQRKRLQKVLNHCARVVFGVRKSARVTPLLEELQWSTIDTRICERDVAMLYRLFNHEHAPQSLRDLISYRSDVSARETRATAAGLLQPPRLRTEMAKRYFWYRALSIWNTAPSCVREAKSPAISRNETGAWLTARGLKG